MTKIPPNRLIKVLPYDSHWSEQFTQEAQSIQKALGPNCIEIHHIGSTAVPGLAAKPVIDMIPVVLDITQVDAMNSLMAALGYEAKGEFGMLFRRFFQKGDTQPSFNVHVFEQGSSEIERHMKFRDWMREHPEDRDAYAQLKQDLAQLHPDDISAYCFGKENFVSGVDKRTGCLGLRVVKALTPREWSAVCHFRQLYFFERMGLTDPYTLTFEHDAHLHFVLYQGTEIIGYAHLQLWPDGRVAMRVIVIDETKRNHHYGHQFLLFCERWLKEQGCKSLHVESSPETLEFYQRNGYIKMQFNDPDGYEGNPQDTALGKILSG
ncbi:bifunctional GrpB family protein/GNAT family N-acetyltransferase [Legionella rowbothamii]|uniref:bifunctional GrpB family protein/GNAT family N-acetyltransferase n=1 Tax=Legionella rowbothamii TaxID=96229 RepID=UPI001055F5A7|nr:bifunctional GrpB family protein/GNAT family N-acetyltransferase [Legionella rowbothamii]